MVDSFIQLGHHLVIILFGFFLLADTHSFEDYLTLLNDFFLFIIESLGSETFALKYLFYKLK